MNQMREIMDNIIQLHQALKTIYRFVSCTESIHECYKLDIPTIMKALYSNVRLPFASHPRSELLLHQEQFLRLIICLNVTIYTSYTDIRIFSCICFVQTESELGEKRVGWYKVNLNNQEKKWLPKQRNEVKVFLYVHFS